MLTASSRLLEDTAFAVRTYESHASAAIYDKNEATRILFLYWDKLLEETCQLEKPYYWSVWFTHPRHG